MIDSALESNHPWLEGITRERLERESHIRMNFEKTTPGQNGADLPTKSYLPFLPFAHGNFFTASGKAELYSESLKEQGLDPVVLFEPPAESRNGERAKAFPLEFLARKADNFLNSACSNLPVIQKREEPGLLEMNADDARPRGIADGDQVRVFNSRGDILLRARVDGAVQHGVVCAHLDWAKLGQQGRNVNVLTSEKLTDLGNSATFYSVLVEVESAKSLS